MESNEIGPFNVGNPHEFSIGNFAKEIKTRLNSESEIMYKELPQDDPKQRSPDISLIKTKIGWEPKIHFDEGIKRTTDYFREIIIN